MKSLILASAMLIFALGAIAQKVNKVVSKPYKVYGKEIGKKFFYPYGKEGDEFEKFYAKVDGDTLYITVEHFKEKTGQLSYVYNYRLPFKHPDLVFSEVKKWYGATDVYQINITGKNKTTFSYDFIDSDGKITPSTGSSYITSLSFNDETAANSLLKSIKK